MYTVLSLSFAI